MEIQPTKILSGERITLPKRFLDQTKLKEGDLVGLIFSGDDLLVTKIKVKVSKV